MSLPLSAPAPLYCFICHRGTTGAQRERIRVMMERRNQPYLFCEGGATDTIYDPRLRTVHLVCDDSYAGLPDKMLALFQYLNTAPEFAAHTHFVKLDEDMVVSRPFSPAELAADYAGRVYVGEGNRRWHIGRCPGSPWNDKPYAGVFVPWCLGGYGYIVSRAAVSVLAKADRVAAVSGDVYEDLMIAKILLLGGIQPTALPKLSECVRPK